MSKSKKTPEIIEQPIAEIIDQSNGEDSNVPAVQKSLSEQALDLVGGRFKVKQQITFPLLKVIDNVPYAVKFISNVYTGKEIEVKRGGVVNEKPARIARVVNLNDGQNYEMIINAVLENVLNENWGKLAVTKDDKMIEAAIPADMIGRMIAFQRHDIEGKRYKGFAVVELEE